MEQRRFIVFVLLSTLILIGWLRVGPLLFPAAFPKPQANRPAAPPAAVVQDEPAEVAASPTEETAADAAAPELPKPAVFDDPGEIILGSRNPASGYFLELRLSARGAAIESATLNDPRFTSAEDRHVQLSVVGNDPAAERQTLQTGVDAIDAQLSSHGLSLRTVVWELVQHDEASATFRYPAPDGTLEVVKSYRLQRGNPENRDGDYQGYLVDFDLSIRNLGERQQTVEYMLQGPVGLPLENADNTRTFIEVKVGTANKPGSPVQYTAASLVKQLKAAAEKNDPSAVDAWRDPLAYIGVDVQYFAALLLPVEDQKQDRDGDGKADPYFDVVRPDLIRKHESKPEQSDISVVLESREIRLAPGAAETHAFRLFLGPKRPELLNPLNAGGIITFGWFSFVSVGMVYALNFFHHVFRLPYGLAIVLLTLIVRGCMFPITRKQAAGAKKMKELQPKLQEIKAKYAKEPEKFWQAQRELFRKHNYSPLSGCLPLVLQLPIFIGLYNALSYDVDLRMAPFLWVDNLAAPDALFSFGRALPLLGWTHFNLLPIITIVLWVIQQKMFMPPPATEEQALQYKVMNYMMIFIGFMIYRVPAGLCVYFITSTLWGIGERKLIDYLKVGEKKTVDEPETIETTATRSTSAPEVPRKPGWIARLVEAADQARVQGTGRTGEHAVTPSGTTRKAQRGGKKRRPRR